LAVFEVYREMGKYDPGLRAHILERSNRDLMRVTISTSRASELQRYSHVFAEDTLWGLPGVVYDAEFVKEKEFDRARADALLGIVTQNSTATVVGPLDFLEQLKSDREWGGAVTEALEDPGNSLVIGVAECECASNRNPVPYVTMNEQQGKRTCGTLQASLFSYELKTTYDRTNREIVPPWVLTRGDPIRWLSRGEGPRVTCLDVVEKQVSNVAEVSDEELGSLRPELFREPNSISSFLITGVPSNGKAGEALASERVLTEEKHGAVFNAAMTERGYVEGRHVLRGLGMLRLRMKGSFRWFAVVAQTWAHNPFLLIDLELLRLVKVHVFRRVDAGKPVAFKAVSLVGCGSPDFGEAARAEGNVETVRREVLHNKFVACVPTDHSGAYDYV
jgi:hypothetical protein